MFGRALASVLVLSTAFTSLSFAAPLSDASNRVGLKLMREAIQQQLKEKGAPNNLMISGLSEFSALSMLSAGLQGKTSQELNTYIQRAENSASFDSEVGQYLTSLEKTPKPPRWRGERPTPTLGIYNSAWATDGKTTGRPYAYSPSYEGVLKNAYRAEVARADFTTQAATDLVNKWAETKTRGLIPSIIDRSTLSDLVWVLMNATYFEGAWESDFFVLPKELAPEFNLLNGDTAKVEMIRTEGIMTYVANSKFEAVEVPFQGGDVVFWVVLPRTPHVYANMQKLGWAYETDLWYKLMSEAQKRDQKPKVRLTLPKFSFDTTVELKKDEDLTQAVGLNFLFSDELTRERDFSPMGTPESPLTRVGLIKQSTKIELDENGVKAAAVTLIGGVERTSLPRQPDANVVVDRPFVFAIVDRKTSTLLFVGNVVNP